MAKNKPNASDVTMLDGRQCEGELPDVEFVKPCISARMKRITLPKIPTTLYMKRKS